MFAELAGKKGGDFYTPRDVIRLMVRILNPTPGLSILRSTCGSGGMLIISREYIEQSGGDATNLRLCGQVNDASAWSICKINMLLHGIRGSDIQLQDTLLHPMQGEAGELERFDRVIANLPFSQNYSRNNMNTISRAVPLGRASNKRQEGRPDVCPAHACDLQGSRHGLVRLCPRRPISWRRCKEIRTKFLKEDLLEAVISLPQNLFYGAGIPACLLVMRPNRTGRYPNPNKPSSRQGKVLFINANAEYFAGRAQNYLLPEHVEKIASTYERSEYIPGYARCVSIDEISDAANDFNLNIRRYVETPPRQSRTMCARILWAECRWPKWRRIETCSSARNSSQAAHSPAVPMIRNKHLRSRNPRTRGHRPAG